MSEGPVSQTWCVDVKSSAFYIKRESEQHLISDAVFEVTDWQNDFKLLIWSVHLCGIIYLLKLHATVNKYLLVFLHYFAGMSKVMHITHSPVAKM